MRQQLGRCREHHPDIFFQCVFVQFFGFFKDHFGVADDRVEWCSQIVAQFRLDLAPCTVRIVGFAVDQAVDEAVQLPGSGADPLKIGCDVDQTEVLHLFESAIPEILRLPAPVQQAAAPHGRRLRGVGTRSWQSCLPIRRLGGSPICGEQLFDFLDKPRQVHRLAVVVIAAGLKRHFPIAGHSVRRKRNDQESRRWPDQP